MMKLQERARVWEQLQQHQLEMQDSGLRIEQLFHDDPDRFHHFSLSCNNVLFDYSKHLLGSQTRELLLALARACSLEDAIAAMFRGEAINTTENRPALHVALRGHQPAQLPEISVAVSRCLQRMASFVGEVHEKTWRGYKGDAITHVVNIGIGGSDLGPAMVTEALRPWHRPGIHCHFVSNVDPSHLHNVLAALHPSTTLFVIASKTFTTLETMENAALARRWYLEKGGSEADIGRHFVAATANVEKAVAFGIDPQNIFPLWDWVGGRYSLWSAIGLPIALAVGMDAFNALLDGGHAADEHFRAAPLEENIPVVMGLLAVWYGSFWQAESQVILPYAQNLHLFPAFLQQLEMESLGKSVDRNGQPVAGSTGLVLWGSAGTNGQHSFHQLLHQGTHLIPADFIAAAHGPHPEKAQHEHLLANCFSQSQALMLGRTPPEPHKVVAGNRPSSTFLLKSLTPGTLGTLIALYEHKVYVQSVIWGINAFDQWGVEIGKQLSGQLYPALQNDSPCTQFDAATNGLVNQYRRFLGQQ